MPFKIVRNDITKMQCDAIVNTANEDPIVGDGCDYAIYTAAGYDRLRQYREDNIGHVEEGEAFITPAYELQAKYIIHAVSPLFVDGNSREEEKLRSCYRKSLQLALENGVQSIAFPLISTGSFGYPIEEGMRIAVDEISAFLLQHKMLIYLVVFGEKATELGTDIYPDLESYIDRNYVDEKYAQEYTDGYGIHAKDSKRAGFGPVGKRRNLMAPVAEFFAKNVRTESIESAATAEAIESEAKNAPAESAETAEASSMNVSSEAAESAETAEASETSSMNVPSETAESAAKNVPSESMESEAVQEKSDEEAEKESVSEYCVDSLRNFDWDDSDFCEQYESGLQERIRHMSDTFSEYLLYLIEDKGMTNAEVYKKAIVDKKVFSKIKNNPDYHPQKMTAMCLCVGARLNLDETKDLLARAGYALSPCDKTDVIFSYFIENKIYDMIELDIQLEEHGLKCLIS